MPLETLMVAARLRVRAHLIGVLHASGAFEVLATSQIVSLSVGEHPSIKAKRDRQMEHYRKIIGEPEGGAS